MDQIRGVFPRPKVSLVGDTLGPRQTGTLLYEILATCLLTSKPSVTDTLDSDVENVDGCHSDEVSYDSDACNA